MAGTRHGGGGVGEEGVAGVVPADSGEGQGSDDEGGVVGVVDGADGARAGFGLADGAAEVDAGVAQPFEGDGVAAGFGEEVAAVAQHVSPPAQPDVRVGRFGVGGGFGVKVGLTLGGAARADPIAGVAAAVRGVPRLDERAIVGAGGAAEETGPVGRLVVGVVADPPACGDEAGGVAAMRVGVLADGVGGDAGGLVPGGLGALGGVFGEVSGDHAVGDLTGPSERDGPDVDLLAPGHGPAFGAVGVLGGGEDGGAGGVVEGVDEVGQGDAGGGGTIAVRSSGWTPSRRIRAWK
jgi:hypothetical protein